MLELGEQQVMDFQRQGYLVVEEVFDPDKDFQPLMDEYTHVLDNLAETLRTNGKIRNTYQHLEFGERLMRICQETGQTYAQHFNASLPPHGFKSDTPYWAGPELFKMLCHPRLLDAVSSIIGDEIYAAPISHVRIKLPESILQGLDEKDRFQFGRTMIHQDSAGLPESADETQMLICWFSLQDVDIENGCLCVWPGSHHRGIYPHQVINERPKIPDEHLREIGEEIAVSMKRGSILLMHKNLLHASYQNDSNTVRWSLDFRYNPIGQPELRSFFPGFVARSRLNRESELKDPVAWNKAWQETHQRWAEKEIPKFHRWS